MSELQKILKALDEGKNEPPIDYSALLKILPEINECLQLAKILHSDLLDEKEKIRVLNPVKFNRLGLLLYRLTT